jgi:uncharacterized phage protein gp47/JayE
MANAIPTILQLYNRISANLINKLGLVLPSDQLKLVLDTVGANIAGELKLLYLNQVDIENNMWPDTADLAVDGGQLNRMGQLRLNRQPFSATDGYYVVTVAGTAGSTLPAQLTYKSNDDSKSPGNLYMLDTPYTLTGSGDVITLRALNAGEDFLLNVNDYLTATQPLIGVNQQVQVTGVTTQPTNAQDTSLYRQQIIATYRLRPQGGAKADYRLWSQDAAGVQQVYPYVKNGDAGVVQVYVEATPVDSVDGNGTPSDALLAAVQSVIDFSPDDTLPTDERGRRPIQAIINQGVQGGAIPIITIPVDIAITGLVTSSAEIIADINNSLVMFLQTIRPYIPACDLASDQNKGLLNPVKAESIVLDTIGDLNSFTGFQLSVDGVATNLYTFAGGNIPYLRNLIFN